MHRRPWPLVLIAVFQMINIPIGLLLSAWVNHVPLDVMMRIIWADSSGFALFQVYLLPFILFFLIFSPTYWSFYVVIAMILAGAYQNASDWFHYARGHSLWALILPNLSSVLLLGYLLFPRVRETFFNPKIRWWQTKPRYLLDHPGQVELGEGRTLDCRVVDLAEGGAGIDCPTGKISAKALRFRIDYEENTVVMNAEVVYSRPFSETTTRYGVQWTASPGVEKAKLHAILARLKEKGIPVSRVVPPWRDDLKAWLARAAVSRDAWLPEYRKRPS